MITDKTLADVQPGGRVRLGDALLPCPLCGNDAEFVPYKNNGLTLKCKSMGCIQRHQRTLRYGIEWLRTSMTEHWNTRALSAQPSPGGQDALDCIGQIEEAIEFRVPHDIYAAVHGELAELKAALAVRKPVTMDDALAAGDGTLHGAIDHWQERALRAEAELAARQPVGENPAWRDELVREAYNRGLADGLNADRQPVGEPFAYTRATTAVDPLPVITPAEYAGLRAQGHGERFRALVFADAAPPAQAVDLGQIIEQIAQQWDGCSYDAVGEPIDIGQAIRAAGKRLADSQAVGK